MTRRTVAFATARSPFGRFRAPRAPIRPNARARASSRAGCPNAGVEHERLGHVLDGPDLVWDHSFMATRSRRGWLLRLLDRGEPPSAAPNAIVEAGYVPLWASEIVVTRLRDIGVRAVSTEERQNPEGPALMARISCRAVDRDEARRIIDDVTTL